MNFTPFFLKTRNTFLFFISLSLFIAVSVHAQGLSILVPYAAGGPSDAVARLMGGKLSSTFGNTPVSVENRLGEGGLLGLSDFVSQSAGSQGVIFMNSSTFFLAVAKKADLLEGIRPVSLVSLVPLVLFVTLRAIRLIVTWTAGLLLWIVL